MTFTIACLLVFLIFVVVYIGVQVGKTARNLDRFLKSVDHPESYLKKSFKMLIYMDNQCYPEGMRISYEYFEAKVLSGQWGYQVITSEHDIPAAYAVFSSEATHGGFLFRVHRFGSIVEGSEFFLINDLISNLISDLPYGALVLLAVPEGYHGGVKFVATLSAKYKYSDTYSTGQLCHWYVHDPFGIYIEESR
jgi:hypothetical protein